MVTCCHLLPPAHLPAGLDCYYPHGGAQILALLEFHPSWMTMTIRLSWRWKIYRCPLDKVHAHPILAVTLLPERSVSATDIRRKSTSPNHAEHSPSLPRLSSDDLPLSPPPLLLFAVDPFVCRRRLSFDRITRMYCGIRDMMFAFYSHVQQCWTIYHVSIQPRLIFQLSFTVAHLLR